MIQWLLDHPRAACVLAVVIPTALGYFGINMSRTGDQHLPAGWEGALIGAAVGLAALGYALLRRRRA